MRTYLAVATAAALACAPAEGGTLYPIDFSTLASDAGHEVDHAKFQAGPLTVYLDYFNVIGPGDPGYTGAIGIVPANNDFLLAIDYEVPSLRTSFGVNSIAATFATTTAGSVIYYDGSVGASYLDGPFFHFHGAAPASGTVTITEPIPAPLPRQAPIIWIEGSNATTAQITGLTVDAVLPADPPAAPEPSGIVLGLIAMGCLAGRSRVATRVSRWARRQSAP